MISCFGEYFRLAPRPQLADKSDQNLKISKTPNRAAG